MRSIVLLIPYFGKWPVWMNLFLDSVKRNETIDFFFFTDCDTDIFEGIKNISFQKMTFDDYISEYKKTLGEDIQIPNAYKICDLRPFFAVVHYDAIKDYEFFGWTDVDVLFGNIRSFYNDDILCKYSVLSTHQKRLSGHLAILSNTKKHRTIGYKIYHWKQALQNPLFVGIDEHGITNALQMTFWDRLFEKFKLSKDRFFLNLIRKIKTRSHFFVEQYTTPFTSIPWIDGTINSSQPSIWYYKQGVISNESDQNRNFIYLHFMNFKSSTWRKDGTIAPWEGKDSIYKVKNTASKIIIDASGIYEDLENTEITDQ